jgi:hypothetical protein
MLVYGLERNAQTPEAKQMPMDIAARALRPETAKAITALDDRAMRQVHRAGSVYAQPVCETMDALRDDVFAKGAAVAEKEKVQKVTGDILYYCDTVFGRLAALTEFAPEAAAFRERVSKDSPELAAFLDETGFRTTVETIVTACKAAWIADMRPQLVDCLDKMAALPEAATADLAAYDAVQNQIASRVEILDSCAARFDFLLRGVMQKAGYRCAGDPAKARLALELRRLLRKSLKNPTYLEQVR